MQKFLF